MKLAHTFIYLLLASISHATLERDIAKAAAIENDLLRLEAYDLAAGKHQLRGPATEPIETTSNWNIRKDTSPIDDSISLYCSVRSEQYVSSGYKRTQPSLYIRHKEGDLDIFINVGDYLGSDTIDVTTRIGKSPAATESWSISTDHKAIFYSGAPFQLINQLDGNESYLFRLTPYGESPITFSFNISGISQVKQAIRETINQNK